MKNLPELFKKTTGGAVQSWTIAVETTPVGTGILVTRYGQVGGKIQEQREEITQGKNLGKSNETSPYEQACAEAVARHKKQITRKGYGLDAAGNESAAKRSVSPMLAHVYDKHARKVDWASAFAQPKLDGFRLLLRRVDGVVTAFSREGKILNVPHIIEAVADVLPDDLILDGELYTHGLTLQQIASAAKRLQDLTAQLQYHVYDCLHADAFEDRHQTVQNFLELLASPALHVVDTVKVRTESELITCQRTFMEDGYEGAMLRHGPMGYEAGKRSDSLLKCKVADDAEFEVVDYKFGRGKLAKAAIFVCVTPAGHHFDVLAPGTIEEKEALGAYGDKLIGKRLTVKYFGFTPTAEPVPFQPVAMRFREDSHGATS